MVSTSAVKATQVLPDLKERLEVLLSQETGQYRQVDYVGQKLPRDKRAQIEATNSVCNNTSNTSPSLDDVNARWREKICEWSYQVVDHFDFSREIVCISLSYLDRFLSVRRADQKIFQLAAMTTLYIAIKLYEPGTLKISSLIKLSRGYFTAAHVRSMEKTILRYVRGVMCFLNILTEKLTFSRRDCVCWRKS